MKIEKTHLDDIKRCYCVSHLKIDNRLYLAYASEDPQVGCYLYDAEDLSQKTQIWYEAGGCMSIVAIPGKNGEFLAVQEFYQKVSPSLAKVVWAKYHPKSGWHYKDLFHLPYIHRIDIYQVAGVNYFIGATIAENKSHKDDWRLPGKIYIGEIPDDLEHDSINLEVIYEGLHRNHGYWRSQEANLDSGYFSSDEGIFHIIPPHHQNNWRIEHILSGQIGEIATIDIDDDGVLEIMTIEPFHGDTIKIYKKIDGKYQAVWQYPHLIEFAHTLVGATIAGRPSFLAGIRRKNAELFCVQYYDNDFHIITIDTQVGPANITVVHHNNKDLLLSANHTNNEAALYRLSAEDR